MFNAIKDRELLTRISNNIFTKETLDLSFTEYDDEDVAALAQALEKNTYIKNLILSNNVIGDEGAKTLAKFGTKNKLKSLNLSANLITSIGARALGASHFESLILNENALEEEVIEVFVNNPVLMELWLANCNITDKGACELFKSKTLKALNLSSTEITDTCLKELPDNSVLQELYLEKTSITELGIEYLTQNNYLKMLSLVDTRLGDTEAKKIATGLKALEALSLSYNNIEDEGALALAQHPTLKTLKLCGNKISSQGARALIESSTLKQIDLSVNKIDNKQIANTASMKGIDVDLSGNPFDTSITYSLNSKQKAFSRSNANNTPKSKASQK